MGLRELTFADYETFRSEHKHVLIGGKPIPLTGGKVIRALGPSDFKLEPTTVWSFPSRGDWATHKANYRGNWSPYVVRNLLERYTKPGDLVLDPMVGGGTTLVECKVMGRNAIGVDINQDAAMLTHDRLNFAYPALFEQLSPTTIQIFRGDARSLDVIDDESIDLVAAHPPYANTIAYSKAKPLEGDLSLVHSFDEFIEGIELVASECFRVLRPGGHAAILIGDTHRNAHYVPISYRLLERFLRAGFVLREDVIKLQWQTATMRGRWHPRFKANFRGLYTTRPRDGTIAEDSLVNRAIIRGGTTWSNVLTVGSFRWRSVGKMADLSEHLGNIGLQGCLPHRERATSDACQYVLNSNSLYGKNYQKSCHALLERKRCSGLTQCPPRRWLSFRKNGVAMMVLLLGSRGVVPRSTAKC